MIESSDDVADDMATITDVELHGCIVGDDVTVMQVMI